MFLVSTVIVFFEFNIDTENLLVHFGTSNHPMPYKIEL